MEGRNGRLKLLLLSPDLSGQIRTEVDFLISEPQFQSNVLSMELDGMWRNIQFQGHVINGYSAGNKACHLCLHWGKTIGQ